MTLVISLEKLSKTYKRSWSRQPVPALKDVSLGVAEGEVFGFIGLILGPVIVTMAIAVLRTYDIELRASRGT